MPESQGRFALPEAVGVPLSREDLAHIVHDSNVEMAAGLQFERMVVLSFAPDDRLLRTVNTVGFPLDEVHDLTVPVDDCPTVREALEEADVRIAPTPADCLPPRLAAYFHGPLAVVPMVIGSRRVAALCGQARPGVSFHSAAWRRAADDMGEKAALVAECQRLQAAYQDALRAQGRVRMVASAIVEQRPLPGILDLIAAHAAERFGVDRVGIYLRDESGLHPVLLRNVPEEYGRSVLQHADRNPIVRRIASGHDPFVIENAASEDGYAPMSDLMAREGIMQIVVAPLQYPHVVRGALCLYPRTPRRMSPLDMSALKLLGDQTAIAIAVSHAMEQQRDTAAAHERTRLAREIHDTLAQALTGIVLQLETLDSVLDSPVAARELVAETQALARSALEETRRSVMGLTPTPLERLDLPDALDREVKIFGQQAHIRTAFAHSGQQQPVSAERKAAVFRIAQEALTNVRKHAQAARVRGALHYGEEQLTLLIEDDGIGFDVSAAQAPGASGGYGLFGMQERARILGGEVRLESTEGWGTRITARIPYDDAAPRPRRAEDAGPTATSETRRALDETPQPAEAAPPSAPVRVVIADDHAVTRQGIRRVLESSGGVQVIGEAADGAKALLLIRELLPDVVLLDVQMPGLTGLQVLQQLQQDGPATPAIVLTSFASDDVLMDCIRAGAMAYVVKDAAPSELPAAVRAVYRGESLIDPSMTARLLNRLRSGPEGGAPGTDLNEREREILRLLTTGIRNKEIASRLSITEKTVEFHLSNLFAKIGVSNRTEAARYAIDRGLTLER